MLARRDEAIRFYTAARAVRPETAHELAHALAARGQTEDAIAVFRDSGPAAPGDAQALACLGEALRARGLLREAEEVLEAAVIAGRALGDPRQARGLSGPCDPRYGTI